MSGTNNGRGGYQGKNFDPNYKNRFQNNSNSNSNSFQNNSSSNGNGEGSSSQGGYKGKNFDPNYHKRFANPTNNALDMFTGLRPGQKPKQPQSQRSSGENKGKNVPTGPKNNLPRCYSRSGQPSSGEGGEQYTQRKRMMNGGADYWVCSCPPGAARCAQAFSQEYEARSRHYIEKLAEAEHTAEVLKTTLERIALANPQLVGAMSECYDAVEAEVVKQEYTFFKSWTPAGSSTELDMPE
ncbi:hypothetical protein BJ166DRAFT_495514 [Pestalotiopsis sp. NC0098]|nr:hypothetical protein BJ166DRAFT_495514 [Pestalotiopsis sp. NC0098]